MTDTNKTANVSMKTKVNNLEAILRDFYKMEEDNNKKETKGRTVYTDNVSAQPLNICAT